MVEVWLILKVNPIESCNLAKKFDFPTNFHIWNPSIPFNPFGPEMQPKITFESHQLQSYWKWLKNFVGIMFHHYSTFRPHEICQSEDEQEQLKPHMFVNGRDRFNVQQGITKIRTTFDVQ